MSGQAYTDVDVKLIAGELRETGMKDAFFDDSSGSREVEEKQHQYEAAARVVLDALASAGRLLPAGTDTVEQFNTRLYRDGVLMEEPDAAQTRDHAQARVDWHDRKRAEDPSWSGRAVLVRRYQHTTPWEPVDEVTL